MKKYFKIVDRINNADQFSNRSIGLESDDVFHSTSDDPMESLDNINEEVGTQIDDGYEDKPLFDDIEDENGDGEDDNYDGWGDAESEDEATKKRDPEDCINMMEIVSVFTNTFRENTVKFGKFLDYSGDFTQVKNYSEYKDVFEKVAGVMNGTKNEYFNSLKTTWDILHSKKMSLVTGDERSPFMYQGIQMAFIVQLHNLYLAIPYSLKAKKTVPEAIEFFNIDKDVKFFDKILTDVIDAMPVVGTKILFKESNKSELTGRSEDINETPYAESDLITDGQEQIVTDFEYAGESIMNLIEIKANKALLEYNVLVRDFALASVYLTAYDIDNLGTIRRTVTKLLLDENTSKLEELLVTTCGILDPVLVNMNKAYKAILKEQA